MSFIGKCPSAYITMDKQRIKQHKITTTGSLCGNNEGTIYLANNSEFEIELFNTLLTRTLADISINGERIGGIVLRPGERVYLDRFIKENKKLLFSTYTVDDSNEVKEAIANNGLVEINFYKEKIDVPNYTPAIWLRGNERIYYNNNNLTGGNTNDFLNFNNYNSPIPTTYCSSSVTMDSFDSGSVLRSGMIGKKSLETGRIEKGSTSNQQFKTVDAEFEHLPVSKFMWKILPKSQEIITKDDMVLFCTECGIKKKKDSHKFCPHCGNKY